MMHSVSSAKNTLVVIPTYNEVDNLEPLVGAVLSSIHGLHVLIVDDNSPDGTGAVADRLADANPAISVIHRKKKEGLGSAYLVGFRHALQKHYSYIVQMDCDFSHDPKDVPRLLNELQQDGVDLVIGSRYARGGKIVNWSLARRILSKGGNWYARLLLGFAIKDWTAGFKVYTREVLNGILSTGHADGYAFLAEMKYRSIATGFKVKEVPIVFTDRFSGESKMGGKIIVDAALQVWKLARHRWLERLRVIFSRLNALATTRK
jgi:dolichol-phosphate mannosyltransferase